MNWKPFVAAFALLPLISPAVAAQSQHATLHSDLVGTWRVLVTLRDCATNAPTGPTMSPSLVTFHAGGTLTEDTSSPAFAPGQRTSGHGRWSRQGGRTYLQEMVNLIRFDTAPNIPGTPAFNPDLPATPGFRAGMVTVTHMVTLSASGELISSGGNAFYDVNGQVYRTGCSTAVGRRFE